MRRGIVGKRRTKFVMKRRCMESYNVSDSRYYTITREKTFAALHKGVQYLNASKRCSHHGAILKLLCDDNKINT